MNADHEFLQSQITGLTNEVQELTEEHEKLLKQYIAALMRVHVSLWTDEDQENLTDAALDLNELGWKVIYLSEGKIRLERLEVASQSEAVDQGYVPE